MMNLDAVDLPDDATYYMCGALVFMQAIAAH
jgi:Na+-transporting NADH:ubiquinone oxidoreductase subunit NqrF